MTRQSNKVGKLREEIVVLGVWKLQASGGRCVLLICLVLLCAPAPAAASDPSFDCTKADGAAEEAVCKSDDLAALDRELARLYPLALKGPHLTADRRATLRAMQRGWIKGRNDCWKAGPALETCVADEYVRRIAAIRAGYADARGDGKDRTSIRPVAYRCSGPSALVSVVFVNVGTPRISLVWGDNDVVFAIARSGSGSRYSSDVAGAGRYTFWIKGNDATFTQPGKPDLSCTVEPTG